MADFVLANLYILTVRLEGRGPPTVPWQLSIKEKKTFFGELQVHRGHHIYSGDPIKANILMKLEQKNFY